MQVINGHEHLGTHVGYINSWLQRNTQTTGHRIFDAVWQKLALEFIPKEIVKMKQLKK